MISILKQPDLYSKANCSVSLAAWKEALQKNYGKR